MSKMTPLLVVRSSLGEGCPFLRVDARGEVLLFAFDAQMARRGVIRHFDIQGIAHEG